MRARERGPQPRIKRVAQGLAGLFLLFAVVANSLILESTAILYLGLAILLDREGWGWELQRWFDARELWREDASTRA